MLSNVMSYKILETVPLIPPEPGHKCSTQHGFLAGSDMARDLNLDICYLKGTVSVISSEDPALRKDGNTRF